MFSYLIKDMLSILRKLFNRRVNTVRECPECGFKGNPRQFKKVKIMTTTTARRDDSHNRPSSSGNVGSGTDGSTGSSGNVGSGNIGSGETRAPSDDAPTSGTSGVTGISGTSGS
jgi:hypothetical protein